MKTGVTVPVAASLDRRLGPLDASAIVISNVIGVGIFTTPGVVAAMLPSTAAMLAVWAFGGALAFAGALAYAELAAWRPQAGGEYVYLRESFGQPRGVPDRLDVVRRRFQRRDRVRVGRRRRLPGSLHPGCR